MDVVNSISSPLTHVYKSTGRQEHSHPQKTVQDPASHGESSSQIPRQFFPSFHRRYGSSRNPRVIIVIQHRHG